jgi:hypothetical protein
LNGCVGAWWDVSRRALNLMEDILSTSYKRTLSAITHKLIFSGLMLVWTFFHASVCGIRAQNLCAPFSYTLYTYDNTQMWQSWEVSLWGYVPGTEWSWLERRVRLSTACGSKLCAGDAMKSRSATAGTSPERRI